MSILRFNNNLGTKKKTMTNHTQSCFTVYKFYIFITKLSFLTEETLLVFQTYVIFNGTPPHIIIIGV
jgi:hypothetical protein